MARTIIVSGAASGLGAAFVRAYAKQDAYIIAIDKLSMPDLKNSNITTYCVDVTSESSIEHFAEQIHDRPIDLFIHSAGVRGLVSQVEAEHPDNVAACETKEVMNQRTLTKTFEINAAGTFLLIRALLPCLQRAADAKVIVMSSRMGSIASNSAAGGSNTAAGSAYAYRASKAAQNAIVRSFAVDMPGITFVLCHPGRVGTGLVRVREEGSITADESVTDMLPLIKQWTLSESGKFFDRFGKNISW